MPASSRARSVTEAPQRIHLATDRSFPSGSTLRRLSLDTIVGYVVEVTVPLAKQWRNANTDNRPIRRNHVELLAKDVDQGRWKVTHQGIAFSKTGRLIDGQHRLEAIIRSGKSAMLTVFVDLDDDMFGALDRGQRRNIPEELREDRRYVDACTWVAARLRNPSGFQSPHPAQVREVLAFYKPTLAQMITVAPGPARLRTVASLKAAVMIRMVAASDADRRLLLDQWTAFARLQAVDMDKTTAALLRRAEAIGAANDRGRSTKLGAAAWAAFDPKLRDMDRIPLRDPLPAITRMMAVANLQLGN